MLSEKAVIESVNLGADVRVGEFAIVRAGARIGSRCIIHPFAFVGDGVEIGADSEVFSGALLGKEPKGAGATSRQPTFARRIVVGPGCSIGPHAIVFYDVEIGEGTLLGDGASIREQGRIGARCLLSRYVTVNYDVTVGDRCKIMDNTHLTGRMRIGSDVFVSTGVSTTNDNAMGKDGFTDETISGPVIEDFAMVGAGAILLPGTVIGRGAVVGAGSVVTRNVAAGTTVMGIPARVRSSA
jgi:acetyltransferase-like isoleucine patch superfamily enzyme